MDLDKIKNSWNELDISASTNENAIKNIMKSNAKTTLYRLITTETFLFFIIIPLLSVPYIVDYFLDGVYILPLFIKTAYILFCLTGLFWQGYKRRLLKQIDIANVGILDNRRFFLKYKLCIKYEIIVGTIFALLLYVAFVYSWKERMTDYIFEVYCWTNVVLCILILLLGIFLYKKVYYKQIKKIESSLNEINNIIQE